MHADKFSGSKVSIISEQQLSRPSTSDRVLQDGPGIWRIVSEFSSFSLYSQKSAS